jgi:two-component system chemotaxis sensor kinase CheA
LPATRSEEKTSMSNDQEEFLKRLRATFKVEAQEHVHAMSAGLLELEKNPSPEAKAKQLETIFRCAHSLKGAARAVNFSEVEAICQALEDVLAPWKTRKGDPSPEALDIVHRAIDQIGLCDLGNEGGPTKVEPKVSAIVQQLGQLASGQSQRTAETPLAIAQLTSIQTLDPSGPIEHARETGSIAPATRALPESPAPVETIRVSIYKLGRLLLEAEEMLMAKQMTAQRAIDLQQIESLFEDWARQRIKTEAKLRLWRNTLPQEHSSARDVSEFLDWNVGFIKSLEAKIRVLGKSAAKDKHTVGKLVEDLIADSKDLLMLPFSTVTDIFPKLVRDLSRDQGKQVDLVIRGGEAEVDKRILEEMKDPLIHLVRNSIDHGIEKPEVRTGRNKSPRGTLTISVTSVDGNKVEILVSDDGAGIDPERVKKAAVRHSVISAEEAEQINDENAIDLIFRSDLSTSPIVTEISGRGLGLAIVREKTEKLGGIVLVESRLTVGTSFRIVLPLTVATFRGVVVRVLGQLFVIPALNVKRALRVKAAEVQTVENRETISFNGRAVSLARMQDVLEMTDSGPPNNSTDLISAILLGIGDEQIAFAVDEVLHEQEVLMKSLAKPLSRVRNIAGATTLASGKVVPILNLADLMKSARKASSTTRSLPVPPARVAQREERVKRALIAEDSITSRMLLKGILESAGYAVKTAVDGAEALTILRIEDFDVVVSDVEMPRMNGFDLTAQIRADKRLADKPVVLVTALASNEDRERGIDVGANAYLVKSSFDQSNLLEVIRRLI